MRCRSQPYVVHYESTEKAKKRKGFIKLRLSRALERSWQFGCKMQAPRSFQDCKLEARRIKRQKIDEGNSNHGHI